MTDAPARQLRRSPAWRASRWSCPTSTRASASSSTPSTSSRPAVARPMPPSPTSWACPRRCRASRTVTLGDQEIVLLQFDPPGSTLPAREHQLRPLVPAFRDHRLGHGQGLRAARGGGTLRADLAGRSGDAAWRHRGVQVPRPRRPSARAAGLSEGRRPRALAAAARPRAVPRHRPFRHLGRRHRRVHALLRGLLRPEEERAARTTRAQHSLAWTTCPMPTSSSPVWRRSTRRRTSRCSATTSASADRSMAPRAPTTSPPPTSCWKTENLEPIVEALTAGSVRFVSPGIVTLGNGTRAIMVLDPDGHRFVIEDRIAT